MCSRNNIAIQQVLLDREFFSVGVIHELKQLGHIFLMPAKKTSPVKKAILEYVEGTRESISECIIRSAGGGGAESYTLVIIPNPKPGKSDITDQYLVFATNIPRGEISKDMPQIQGEYRKRWGIETSYACIGRLRPQTTSPSNSVRLIMFYFPLMYYNIWIVTNCAIRKKMKQKMFQNMIQKMFQKMLQKMLQKMIQNKTTNQYCQLK